MKKIVEKDRNNTITYLINEEKRVVTCVISGCENDIIKVLNRYGKTAGIYGVFPSSIQGQDSFMGAAVCHENDTFDETVGMRIAKTRAQRERLNYRNNLIRKTINCLDHFANVLEEYAIKELPKEYRPEAETAVQE